MDNYFIVMLSICVVVSCFNCDFVLFGGWWGDLIDEENSKSNIV